MFGVGGMVLGEDEDVVQVYDHVRPLQVFEDAVHHVLKGHWGIC